MEAQFLTSLPSGLFQDILDGKVTVTEAKRRAKRARSRENLRKAVTPTGKFRVHYADPPWQYANKGLPEYGHAESHYPTMSIPELCAMDVKSLAEENAVLCFGRHRHFSRSHSR